MLHAELSPRSFGRTFSKLPCLSTTAAVRSLQASLNQKQRLQQLFFPEGIAFDGKRFIRTAVAAHGFNYLTCADGQENQLASLMPGSWNQITSWLQQIDGLRRVA